MMGDIIYLQHTASTNRVAYQLAMNGEPEGTAVVAESQGEGRGRLGKVWESPKGKGLYCSVIVRPRLALEDYPKITLTAGLAVAIALEELSGFEMQLKWPNDVYTGGKKCCGILTESAPLAENHTSPFAIVGIGINVNSLQNDFPDALHDKVTSLRMLSGKVYDIHAIFDRVRRHLFEQIRILESMGFACILDQWRKKDMLAGKRLQWLSISGEIIYGHSEGPDESGRLLVRDNKGTMHQILSGDITLVEKMKDMGRRG